MVWLRWLKRFQAGLLEHYFRNSEALLRKRLQQKRIEEKMLDLVKKLLSQKLKLRGLRKKAQGLKRGC